MCRSDLRLIDFYCGWPGSVHDARVFRNSPIRRHLEGAGSLPSKFHLLGDSAYGLRSYMMVPFKDNGHLTAIEKNFNKLHSSTRVDVERYFGLLKCKFRRLMNLPMHNQKLVPVFINAACVIVNFLQENESILEELEEVVHVDEAEAHGAAEPFAEEDDNTVDQPAAVKRFELANILA